MKKIQQEQSYFDYISPRCDLNHEDCEPVFLHDIPAYDSTPPYQVWFKTVERFKRYRPDKIRTHGQNNSNIATPSPIYIYIHGNTETAFKNGRGRKSSKSNDTDPDEVLEAVDACLKSGHLLLGALPVSLRRGQSHP